MELKIYSPQEAGFLQKIDWNFDELKQEIQEAARSYETSVYTDDTIKAAKADRAKLNKLVDAIKGKRTEIRKKLLEPDVLFGEQVNELTSIIQSAITNIDEQVKDFEQRQRAAKKEKIHEFYMENIHDLEEYLPFERVFRPEYANASTTMKSIKEDILALIQRVAEGISILNEVDSKYAGDMKAVFLKTYDIGAAMAERNNLEAEEQKRAAYMAEQERIKVEREAARRTEAERVINAGRKSEPVVSEMETPESKVSHKTETVENPIHVIDFRVFATLAQLNQLKTFLKDNGIRFEPVPK